MKVLEKKVLAPSVKSTHLTKRYIVNSWAKITPFYGLKNFIALNPLSGFEDLPFEQALEEAQILFQQKHMPEQMERVNRETIKWLQIFFDEGQAAISMPLRHLGLLKSTLSLLKFDNSLPKKNKKMQRLLGKLPENKEKIIEEALSYLELKGEQRELFLTLLLTTLPGWAGYIKYKAIAGEDLNQELQQEYLSLRLILFLLVYGDGEALLSWHYAGVKTKASRGILKKVEEDEKAFQCKLLSKLNLLKDMQDDRQIKAQLAFCIDVRSEPIRRLLEEEGAYQTFGVAGFFGLPISITNCKTGEIKNSCPPIVKPLQNVVEKSVDSAGQRNLKLIRRVYQSLKYCFVTPFSLVETVGGVSGAWMALKMFTPNIAGFIKTICKKAITPNRRMYLDISTIPFRQKVSYVKSLLEGMDLVENFAPLVVFCGHGSSTENNAYASALDCGACGGNKGGKNAQIITTILNDKEVRGALKKQGIDISETTFFLAAEHNTTTDEVVFYAEEVDEHIKEQVEVLGQDLQIVRERGCYIRSKKMGMNLNAKGGLKHALKCSKDWSQSRPEWGLAENAAFIIGPGNLRKGVDLDGRCFLHSYNFEKDPSGSILRSIFAGPVMVAHSISAAYFFSTYDNSAFGAGSKVTKNITGKMGAMQGNASDLMTGLPLQSVMSSDSTSYHKLLRLTVVIYAPKEHIKDVIQELELKKLLKNGWMHMICIDPISKEKFHFERDCTWKKILV